MTRNILEWLENAAGRTPHRTAYDSPEKCVSWGEILTQTKRIGTYIARRMSAQSPVLILMEKGPDCIAAMLGSVWAGCFYTPLDSSMPEARMQLVAEVLQPALIICEEKFQKTAENIAGGAGICSYEKLVGSFSASREEAAVSNDTEMSPGNEDIDEVLLKKRREEHIDTDLLYVLFTSGSTGIPKGVSITHRSVIDFIEWACEALQLPDGVRFGSQAPFYFDNSVLDIYSVMRKCGSLFVISKSDFLFPKRLAATLQTQQIDTIFWVPSALTALIKAEVLKPGMLKLQRVFFCGEVMPCSTLNLWKKVLPEADYVNMYGPTEITDVCSWYRIDRIFQDTEVLPIGRPCANTRIYLIDGELCVGGSCLAAGYYNASEKTEEVFVQNPLRRQIQERIYKTGDLAEYNEYGELMFLGRKDSQIKKSGYRIELGEIETALNAADGVLLGCCWYDAECEQITAVYTGTAAEKEVKTSLKKALPRYMIPDLFVRTDELPRTGSGKIDRMTLKQRYKRMK